MLIPRTHYLRSGPTYREHVEHVLRNLAMVARLQLDRPSMTTEHLARTVLENIDRIVTLGRPLHLQRQGSSDECT